MNILVLSLGEALKQIGLAVKYSTANNNIGRHWTNNAIDDAIKHLNEAKIINLEQERSEASGLE